MDYHSRLKHKKLMTRILNCIEEAGEETLGCVINTTKSEDDNYSTQDGLEEFLTALHDLHANGYLRFREHGKTRGGRWIRLDRVEPPLPPSALQYSERERAWLSNWEKDLYVETTKE